MTASWIIILFAVLIYGVLHSLLASFWAKARAERWIGPQAERWYRLSYNIFAVISFLPVLALLAVLPDAPLYSIPPPWAYLALAGQLAAILALAVGVMQTGALSFLGLQQLLEPNHAKPTQLVTKGMYRWVRHPLYTAGLAFLWLTPVMTRNLFALYLGLSIYLVVGALFEERKLVREFGEVYIQYREKTPMLIPGLRLNYFRNPIKSD